MRQYLTIDETKEYFNKLDPSLLKTKSGENIKKALDSFDQLQIGNKAPDFSAKNPDGKEISLKESLGKVTIIDFWASWCGPCRKENPNVVEAYAKYKSMKFKNAKGFEVYSVSLDRAEDLWKKAIIDDKLTWKNHGWDKEGKAAKAYNVNAIPTAFLVDGDGVIVASGAELRGMGLHLALDKQLK